MKFKLIDYHRGNKLENPTLEELLTDKNPFVIQTLPLDPRSRRNSLVYSELYNAPEPLLRGILFLDHEQDLTYFLERGEKEFKIKERRLSGPWQGDKFHVYANYYETTSTSAELKQEFERLGYTFER
ncbi:TPA: hypothetical protein HA246_07525 [Candidatus Woesearchaeota archaeon]|nr:hypothetical protein [Candidatus Woesearchaeota archaeon]